MDHDAVAAWRAAGARLIPVTAGVLHSMADTGEKRLMPKAAPR
ncbi:hypothetical protein [Paractinoplanes lichenicola]|nr:hypothetical protein [Actinoplanes lichenicola]